MKILKSLSGKTLLAAVICILIVLICTAPVFAHNKVPVYVGLGEKYNIETTYQYIDSNCHRQIQTGLVRYPVYHYYNGKWHFFGYLKDVDSFRTEGYPLLHRINPQTGRCIDCGYKIRYQHRNCWDGRSKNAPPGIPPPPPM